MAHAGSPKNPYAAVWAEAEKRLVEQIRAIHELGVDIDKSRHNLNWQGPSAHRFQSRAHTRHELLHQHNDTLRYILKLVQLAAESAPAHAPTTSAAAR